MPSDDECSLVVSEIRFSCGHDSTSITGIWICMERTGSRHTPNMGYHGDDGLMQATLEAVDGSHLGGLFVKVVPTDSDTKLIIIIIIIRFVKRQNVKRLPWR